MIHKHNVNNELNIIHSRSPKNFFNNANKKMCSHSKLGPLIDTNGICQTDDQTKCEILNEFFSSVFTNDNGILPMVSKQALNISSNKIDFSQSVIIKAIKKLKPSGSAGPDLFPALFWRNATPGVALPLSIIFSNSFALSTLPDEWRLATVIPVFKKGSPSNPNNYRPISLTCIPCKIMESIIKDHMINFLNSNDILSANQHGFTFNKSTFTQLVECLHD